MMTDKVLEDLQGAGGTVLRKSLDHTKENALREALAGHVAAAASALRMPATAWISDTCQAAALLALPLGKSPRVIRYNQRKR
jgi:hypothetical protein